MRVEVLNRGSGKRVSLRRWKTKTEKILRLLKQTRSEVCVTLTGNREIRKLNAAFRNKRTATDVLSFPAGDIPD
ncbi:MAG: rRNA maturation RNAse YbeY, partial [Candidatus Binatia bacterium]